jgi:hypothetical protein
LPLGGPNKNIAFNISIVGVFTDTLHRNDRFFIRPLHSNGCTRYNIEMTNTKIDDIEMRFKALCPIHFAHDKVQRQAFVNTEINFQIV